MVFVHPTWTARLSRGAAARLARLLRLASVAIVAVIVGVFLLLIGIGIERRATRHDRLDPGVVGFVVRGFVCRRKREFELLFPFTRNAAELARVRVGGQKLRSRVPEQELAQQNLSPLVHVYQHAANLAVVSMQQIDPVRANLGERRHRGRQHEGRTVAQHRFDDFDQLFFSRVIHSVNFWDRMSRRFPHIRTRIDRAFSRRQYNHRHDDLDANA